MADDSHRIRTRRVRRRRHRQCLCLGRRDLEGWLSGDIWKVLRCRANSAGFCDFQRAAGQSVDFGKGEITVNRNASIGAKLNVPEAADFYLQGGPNVSEVRSVLLSADSAQVFTINQTAVQDTINACSVRAACTNSISANQGIVTRLLVAKNLKYSVKLSRAN